MKRPHPSAGQPSHPLPLGIFMDCRGIFRCSEQRQLVEANCRRRGPAHDCSSHRERHGHHRSHGCDQSQHSPAFHRSHTHGRPSRRIALVSGRIAGLYGLGVCPASLHSNAAHSQAVARAAYSCGIGVDSLCTLLGQRTARWGPPQRESRFPHQNRGGENPDVGTAGARSLSHHKIGWSFLCRLW